MKAMDLNVDEKIGAGCLLIAKDTNCFLLIQRSDYVPAPLTWGIPGGKAQQGETPKETAIRETKEEIGFDTQPYPLKLIYSNEVHAPRFRFYTYACLVDQEFDPSLNWESCSHRWCSMDDLPSPLHWGIKQMVKHDRSAKILKSFIEQQKSS